MMICGLLQLRHSKANLPNHLCLLVGFPPRTIWMPERSISLLLDHTIKKLKQRGDEKAEIIQDYMQMFPSIDWRDGDLVTSV